MHKTKVLALLMVITAITACSSATQHNPVSSTCVIKMDTPEGDLPGKIEQASSNSDECKAIEKAIDKSIWPHHSS
nr:thiamine biosynthesis protein ApbE [Providencia stuartii]